MTDNSMNRRRFLSVVGNITTGAFAVGVLNRPARALSAMAVRSVDSVGNPLRIPGRLNAATIVARIGEQEVWPGEPINLWMLGDSYPASTIVARRGERLRVALRNELPEETIIHWHGQIVPHDMDGHPMDAIAPGETYQFDFEVINRAGTYWYHPHPHGRTAPQVYKGMAGFFIVTDDEEQALDLPRDEFDIPLLVQDRRSSTSHDFEYAPTSVDRLNGLLGDVVLANGTPDAYHQISADLYRLRVVNGSNARIMRLGFTTGKPFHVIATDGGLLDKPYEVGSVFLGPAERVELLVDFAGHAVGESLQFSTLEWGSATQPTQPGYAFPIVRFDVVRPATKSSSIPATLASLELLDPAQAVRTRVWELDTSPIPRGGKFHWINGRVFEMERVDANVRAGEIEIWELRNLHIMPHPIHIHGVQFQIIERIGKGPIEPRDLGWKDTVIVWGEETVRLIVRFAPYRGVYLIHCHNLEHEDGGMMLNFEIGDTVSDVQIVPELPVELDLR
jgi:FtsP/CotA-like multicopper oxidase with cupredoxin domain